MQHVTTQGDVCFQEYLERYQYLGERCPDAEIRDLSKTDPDKAFELAVKNFQEFAGLPSTGKHPFKLECGDIGIKL